MLKENMDNLDWHAESVNRIMPFTSNIANLVNQKKACNPKPFGRNKKSRLLPYFDNSNYFSQTLDNTVYDYYDFLPEQQCTATLDSAPSYSWSFLPGSPDWVSRCWRVKVEKGIRFHE